MDKKRSIKVTEEMISSGVNALYRFADDIPQPRAEWIVMEVYASMTYCSQETKLAQKGRKRRELYG